MEALRIQIDQQKWETNQLRAENQILHDNNEKPATWVYLEQELETSNTRLSELEEICAALKENTATMKGDLEDANLEIFGCEREQ